MGLFLLQVLKHVCIVQKYFFPFCLFLLFCHCSFLPKAVKGDSLALCCDNFNRPESSEQHRHSQQFHCGGKASHWRSSYHYVWLCQILGVSWCCGNYCWLAFVLWCGYCSVSFQSFVLRHWCPQHQETTKSFRVFIIHTKYRQFLRSVVMIMIFTLRP